MTPEMMRAGEVAQRLWRFTNGPAPKFLEVAAEAPRLCEDAMAVIKELMDEITRMENRAEKARGKADELVGWLNGRWG